MQPTREFSEVSIHPICPRTNLTFAETELLRCSALWQRLMELAIQQTLSGDIPQRSAYAPEYTSHCLSWWRDAKHRSDTFERAAAEQCWREVTRQLDLFEGVTTR